MAEGGGARAREQRGMRLLPLAAILNQATAQALPAAGTPSLAPGAWTDANWAKCDTVDDGGKWDIETHEGGKWMNIIERESGRCLAIKDCMFTTGGDAYGRLVVEPCTTSNSCGGKNQQWRFRDQHATPVLITTTPPAKACAIESGTEGFSEVGQHWCACDVFTPSLVGGTLVNVAGYCGASNSQFDVSKLTEDGTIRLRDGQHSSLGQCLHARPCDDSAKPPCTLPAAWGWTFVIALSVCAAVYGGGGIGFGVRSQGKPPGVDAHPHYEQLSAIGGLVQDGVAWTQTQIANRRGGGEAQAPLVGGKAGKGKTPAAAEDDENES